MSMGILFKLIIDIINAMKIVFFGGSKHVIPVLEELKDKLSLVITTEKGNNEPVIGFCIKNKIPYLFETSFDENLKSSIINLKSPVAVLADFGLKIPTEVLDIFPKGIINIHPSLLPKYRGPTPVQTAILNGDKIAGVSLIKLDEKIDQGPILAKQEEEIKDSDTADSLYNRLFKIGSELLNKYLEEYLDGKVKLIEQNEKEASYTKILIRRSGFFDIKNPPKKEVFQRMIRAFYPWPGVWTKAKFDDQEKIVKFLPGNKIQVEGKKPVSYKDFENGYPISYNLLKQVL